MSKRSTSPNANQDIQTTQLASFLKSWSEDFQSNQDLSSELAKQGWGSVDICEGLTLCEQLERAQSSLKQAQEAQAAAESVYQETFTKARQAFIAYRETFSALVKHGVLRYELGLDGELPKNGRALLNTAQSGYKVAYNTPAFLNLLRQANLPLTLLDEGWSALSAFKKADDRLETIKAMVVDAVIDCDLASNRLKDWQWELRQGLKKVRRAYPQIAEVEELQSWL